MNNVEKKIKVLVADDDELMRTTLVKKIEEAGIATLVAADGEKALMIALTLRPSLVLLDVEMPKLDGVQVIEKIRTDEWGKTVPVIFLTGYDTDDHMIDAISAYNPTFYLRKGQVTPADIVQRIKEALKIV